MVESQKYKEEILNVINDLSDEQISNLLQIIHIFKESLILQKEYDFELKKEFEDWDRLSDEAIINFERTL